MFILIFRDNERDEWQCWTRPFLSYPEADRMGEKLDCEFFIERVKSPEKTVEFIMDELRALGVLPWKE